MQEFKKTVRLWEQTAAEAADDRHDNSMILKNMMNAADLGRRRPCGGSVISYEKMETS